MSNMQWKWRNRKDMRTGVINTNAKFALNLLWAERLIEQGIMSNKFEYWMGTRTEKPERVLEEVSLFTEPVFNGKYVGEWKWQWRSVKYELLDRLAKELDNSNAKVLVAVELREKGAPLMWQWFPDMGKWTPGVDVKLADSMRKNGVSL